MENETLVSVVVVTYNSADYIIETLESIKNQTYKNIEVVVTDDSSSDNTMELVEKWLAENKERFCKYRIVKSSSNTGVTCNCNRGIKAATGKYIKFLAGDDLLLEDCVEKLLDYCIKNNLDFAFAKVIPFVDSDNKSYESKIDSYEKLMYEIFDFDAKQQYRNLLKGFYMYTIGLFIKTEFMLNIGGFDEGYKMLEDYPFAVKVTSMGCKMNLLDSYVIKYRIRTPNRKTVFFSSKRKTMHSSDLERFESKELLPRMKKERMYIAMYDLFIKRLSAKIDNLNSSLIFSYVSKIVGYLAFSKIAFRIRMIGLNHKN